MIFGLTIGSATLALLMGFVMGFCASIQAWLQQLAIRDDKAGVKPQIYYALPGRILAYLVTFGFMLATAFVIRHGYIGRPAFGIIAFVSAGVIALLIYRICWKRRV